MPDLTALLHEPDTTIALVGATDNRSKYGSIIFQDLTAKGFTVFPVNRHRATVHGQKAYASLADLPEAPTIVNIVVPPHETLTVLEEARRLGYLNVWVQPGADNAAVHEYVAQHGFEALVGPCIMVRSRIRA